MTNRMCASFILSVFLCCTAAARTIPGTSLSPAVWYQSNNVVTDEYGNTESITDLSGGGNHASQPNSACRPALDAGVLPNGRPALLFDGNDSLQMSRPLLLTNCVCFAVVRPNITDYSVSSVRNKTILGGNKQSMQWIIRQKESGTLHSEVLCRSVKSCASVSSSLSTNEFVLAALEIKYIDPENSTFRLRQNGEYMTDEAAKEVSIGEVSGEIGSAKSWDYMTGHIASVVIFTNSLSLAEIESVEQYLSEWYAGQPQTMISLH